MSPAAIANLERTLSAFLALVTKLEQIGEDPEFRYVFTLSAIHGHQYSGPSWERELAEAQAALREAQALGLSAEPSDSEIPRSTVSEGAGSSGAGDRP